MPSDVLQMWNEVAEEFSTKMMPSNKHTLLQMTTLNGAKFLGREPTMGTVEAGKDANLVLLDANPLSSVQNLHKINAVVRGGTYYSRAALDDLMRHAEQQP